MAININLYRKLENYDEEICYLGKMLLDELDKENKSKVKIEELILEEVKEMIWEDLQ